ncbi:hypothetical protein MMC11_005306 [Xylographa trunciseda]|nr:hypothetical protein [Xylographa trunciseda]
MPSLMSVEHKGIIYQEPVERLQEAKSLHRLVLRSGKFLEECVMWDNDLEELGQVKGFSSDLKLNLKVLEKLSRLRVLTIDSLLPGEDDLLLAVFPEEASLALKDNEPQPSGFPKTLKALSIIDKYSAATALDPYFFEFRVKSLIGVTTLEIHLNCIHNAKHLSLAYVLQAFLSPTIDYLEVPLYEDLDAHPEVDGTDRTRAQEVAFLLKSLLPYRETIKEWVFPTWSAYRSFNDHPAELDALWAGSPSYRQICLGDLEGADRGRVQDRYLTASLFDDTISGQTHDIDTGIIQPRIREPSS